MVTELTGIYGLLGTGIIVISSIGVFLVKSNMELSKRITDLCMRITKLETQREMDHGKQ